MKKEDLVTLLEDAFFASEEDRGLYFHIRRTNLFREKRTLNIIDELDEREKMQKALEEAEAKKVMSYDEFLTKYHDMIEGKTKPDPEKAYSTTHSRPVTGYKDDNKSDGASASGRKSKANNSVMSKGSKSGTQSMNQTKDGFDVNNDIRYDIPESCFLIMMKGNKISKMQKRFKLLSHPFPILEGEMILF